MDAEWDVSQIIEGKRVDEYKEEIEKLVSAFQDCKSLLKDDISETDFLEIIERQKVVRDMMGRLGAYAGKLVDTDSGNSEKRALQSGVQAFLSKSANRMRFFSHWWKGVSEGVAARLLAALGNDRYVFEHLRVLAKHTLPEEHENLITIKDSTGVDALVTIQTIIGSRTTYVMRGESLADAEIRSKFQSPDHETRKEAYGIFFETRKREEDVLSEIYKNLVLDWENERELRKYPSPISVRNMANDLPDEAVQAHLEACREGAKLFQRYFRLKQTLLGIPLTRYDIYAPLRTAEEEYSYEQAVQMVLEAFGTFSPRLRDAAEEIYAGKYVHVYPSKGKRQGAYCSSPSAYLPPFLLYNFTGKLRDVSTIAHETGHGVHHQLARPQGPIASGHALPIAETASVFSELLLADFLESQASDAVKKALLVDQLNDMYATICRQSFFTIFEQEAHRLIKEGASTERISEAYRKNLEEQFGGVISIPDEFADEWLAIPHFYHTPFYCYAYSFGNLLSLALYEQYKREGEGFVAKYESFLAAGETMSPARLCQEILAVDITAKEFWQQGFAVIERMIERLENLD